MYLPTNSSLAYITKFPSFSSCSLSDLQMRETTDSRAPQPKIGLRSQHLASQDELEKHFAYKDFFVGNFTKNDRMRSRRRVKRRGGWGSVVCEGGRQPGSSECPRLSGRTNPSLQVSAPAGYL